MQTRESLPPSITVEQDLLNPNVVEGLSTEIVYANPELYQRVVDIKREFNSLPDKIFLDARAATNPFESLGKGIFATRAALKIANIDAVYKISGLIGGWINIGSCMPYYFVDLAGGPGSWTQYIQYRNALAKGYGMTLGVYEESPGVWKKVENDWNASIIDLEQFVPIRGETGNLITEYQKVIDRILLDTNIVDLAISDGGMEFSGKEEEREEGMLRLIMIEIYLSLVLLKDGHNMVCKITGAVSAVMGDLLYLTARCFRELSIFKPVSSRPANDERYLIGLGRRSNIDTELDILRVAIEQAPEVLFRSLLVDIPAEFVSWLTQENNRSLELQLQASQSILNYVLESVIRASSARSLAEYIPNTQLRISVENYLDAIRKDFKDIKVYDRYRSWVLDKFDTIASSQQDVVDYLLRAHSTIPKVYAFKAFALWNIRPL